MRFNPNVARFPVSLLAATGIFLGGVACSSSSPNKAKPMPPSRHVVDERNRGDKSATLLYQKQNGKVGAAGNGTQMNIKIYSDLTAEYRMTADGHNDEYILYPRIHCDTSKLVSDTAILHLPDAAGSSETIRNLVGNELDAVCDDNVLDAADMTYLKKLAPNT